MTKIYFTHDGSEHHTHNITEHKAPTDESLKLLKEMEDSVKEKVFWKSGAVQLNGFIRCEAVIHRDLSDWYGKNLIMTCRFHIDKYFDNETKHLYDEYQNVEFIKEVSRKLPSDFIDCYGEEDLVFKIKENLKEISGEFVEEFTKGMVYDAFDLNGWDLMRAQYKETSRTNLK